MRAGAPDTNRTSHHIDGITVFGCSKLSLLAKSEIREVTFCIGHAQGDLDVDSVIQILHLSYS